MKILLVEDQLILADALTRRLIRSGYAADWVNDIHGARGALKASHYQLILLDLGLPDGDGFTFLRQLRTEGWDGAVIIITAKDQVSDCIEGLNAGADDFLTKPFNLGVLIARVEAVRRRYVGQPSPLQKVGNLVINTTNNQVWVDGKEATLTLREWSILRILIDRAGTVVSKDAIEQELYRAGHAIKSNTVEAYVSRLRKKLGATTITTAHGVGYRLVGDR